MLILGSGYVGYSAAVYAARMKLEPLLVKDNVKVVSAEQRDHLEPV